MARLLLVVGPPGPDDGARSPAATIAVRAARTGVKTVLATGVALDDRQPEELDEPGLSVVAVAAPGFDARPLADQLGVDPVPSLLLATAPWIAQVTRWLALPELISSTPADLVVVEVGTVGSAAQLLAAPAGLRACLDQLLPVGRRIQRAMSLPADPLSRTVDRVLERLSVLGDLLSAPQASVHLTAAGSTGPARARRWVPWLAAYGCRVEVVEEAGARATDRDALLAPSAVAPPRQLDGDDEGYRLTLRMPWARRADLTLHRVADDLVLDASAGRHPPAVIALPSVLRRCQVAGARLDGAQGPAAQLQVRFTPDPELWPDR